MAKKKLYPWTLEEIRQKYLDVYKNDPPEEFMPFVYRSARGKEGFVDILIMHIAQSFWCMENASKVKGADLGWRMKTGNLSKKDMKLIKKAFKWIVKYLGDIMCDDIKIKNHKERMGLIDELDEVFEKQYDKERKFATELFNKSLEKGVKEYKKELKKTVDEEIARIDKQEKEILKFLKKKDKENEGK